MKNENEHLPLMGVGPIILAPQLIITAAAILLSETGKLCAFQVDFIKIPLMAIGIVLILFVIYLWCCSNFKIKIDKYIEGNIILFADG